MPADGCSGTAPRGTTGEPAVCRAPGVARARLKGRRPACRHGAGKAGARGMAKATFGEDLTTPRRAIGAELIEGCRESCDVTEADGPGASSACSELVREKCLHARPPPPFFAGARHGVWPCARRWCGIAGDGDAVIKRETRASGGCLGTERRRRTWHAAKSPGEMRAIGDPGISEWGNPPARVSSAESIGWGGKPGELKHLSNRRKGHQPRLRE